MQRLTILGATGSIGTNTLDVVERHPDRFEVHALTGFSRIDVLAEQCARFRPRRVVVPDGAAAQRLQALLGNAHHSIAIDHGPEALCDVAAEADTVMAAIVGAAGLPPVLAAARAGKRILLANKEAMVMAGPLFTAVVRENGATLLPIDSEHNAIFQCLPDVNHQSSEPPADTLSRSGKTRAGIARIILTASGGPFRTLPLEQLEQVTPQQACAHPNWVMGRKISVDSATMMNKGLEVIEARWLFDVAPDRIDVVIHPQSVIHSLVSYVDGSVLAQLGNPDMRTPIAHALGYPDRIDAGVTPLDLTRIGQLAFEAPDLHRFPCLALAYEALRAGGTAPAVLNAANEVAVAAFLDGRIGFTRIAALVEAALAAVPSISPRGFDDIFAADTAARLCVYQLLKQTLGSHS